MSYYTTIDKNGLLRIEDDEASITLLTVKDRAQILSLMVSEESRREGLGRDIMASAEEELCHRGIRILESDFLKDVENMQPFLESCGFELRKSVPIVAVETEILLNSRAVQKAMRCSIYDAFFMPAQEILAIQWDELFKLFKKLSIPIERYDLDYFAENLSGVVYDENVIPRAFIFCTVMDDVLFVDFLGGVSKKNPQFIMAAVQGMLRCLEEGSGVERYSQIVMLVSDSTVGQLLKRALGRGAEPKETGWTYHAQKELRETGAELPRQVTDSLLVDNPGETLMREYADFPIQKNVAWKVAYAARR